MKKLFFLTPLLFLVACGSSGYKQFYYPISDISQIQDVEKLSTNEEPKVYRSDNIERDISILRSKNFLVVGYSAFNGVYEDIDKAKIQAKTIGATLVITNAKYTNTLSSQVPLFVPYKTTTKYYGNINTSKNSGFISGLISTTGTKTAYYTSNEMRFDQFAVYFVKSTRKPHFGVILNDLTPDDRVLLKRNTGAKIIIVVEDTPCFYANLLPGDILIKINEKIVNNTQQAISLMQDLQDKKECKFTILRENNEQELTINLE